MAKIPNRDPDDIADVGGLFSEGSVPSHDPIRPGMTPGEAIGSGYDLEEDDADEAAEPPRWKGAPLPPPDKPPTRPKPKAEREDAPERPRKKAARDDFDEPEVRRPRGEESRVDEVWTRWAEWGPTVTLLAIVAAGVFVLTYFVGSTASLGLAFLVLMVGLVALVLLSYPIAVTLERPIRMTPETAVKDFYGAASHHFPQYRRMWALLSATGKASREFDSFASFRSYWKHRMTRLRGGKVGGFKPLTFEVKEFRGDKSAGQTSVDIEYTVAVRARDAEGPPLEEVRIETSSVKGPDNMWYLDLGTLPERRRSAG